MRKFAYTLEDGDYYVTHYKTGVRTIVSSRQLENLGMKALKDKLDESDQLPTTKEESK